MKAKIKDYLCSHNDFKIIKEDNDFSKAFSTLLGTVQYYEAKCSECNATFYTARRPKK